MEIHIGNRVADVTLVSKEGNKVQLTIDGVAVRLYTMVNRIILNLSARKAERAIQ